MSHDEYADPQPIVGVNAEPCTAEFDLCRIWPEDREASVYVNPTQAVGAWHSYAYRSDEASPPKAADPEWDLPDDYLETLYYSETFQCFYVHNVGAWEWGYRSPQQAAWWLAQQRVRTKDWPEVLQGYLPWAAENLAAHDVPLEQWPQGLVPYAPYYAYNLSEACQALHAQAAQLTTLCAHLVTLESSQEVASDLRAMEAPLMQAAALIHEAQVHAARHLL